MARFLTMFGLTCLIGGMAASTMRMLLAWTTLPTSISDIRESRLS